MLEQEYNIYDASINSIVAILAELQKYRYLVLPTDSQFTKRIVREFGHISLGKKGGGWNHFVIATSSTRYISDAMSVGKNSLETYDGNTKYNVNFFTKLLLNEAVKYQL